MAQTPPSTEEDLASVYGDTTTLSLATGSQKPLRLAPAVATVITAADIKAMGATELDQVLESVPGLHVQRNHGQYQPIWVVRGIYSDQNQQILLLQNGIPLTTAYVGNKGNAWGGLPLQQVARIELIRGPGSALYGADAFSGVINIITKTADDIRGTEVGVNAGSFETREAWVQHGGQWQGLGVAAYLRVMHTRGQSELITADSQTARDKLTGTHASLAPGRVNTGYDAVDAGLELTGTQWHGRLGYMGRDNLGDGAGTIGALDPVGRVASGRVLADVGWRNPRWTDAWALEANLSYLHYIQRVPTVLQLSPPGSQFGKAVFVDGLQGSPETSERQLRFSMAATYTGWVGHQWRFGVGHDDINLYATRTRKNSVPGPSGALTPIGHLETFVGSAGFLPPSQRRIDYLYAQDEWQLVRDWTLTAGLRHDHYSDAGGTTNPRLALVWAAGADVTVKLLYGQAFRAPAFVELYQVNAPAQRGNPLLRPESVKTTEMAVVWQLRPQLQWRLNVFRFAMTDIIRTTRDANGLTSTYHNIGKQSGKGLESEWSWQVGRDVNLRGNYSNQSNTDEATGTDSGIVPHHHLFVRADWTIASRWQASVQLNGVADRRRAFGDNRPKMADYRTLDLVLRTSVGPWECWAGVRNLFNADAREPSSTSVSIPNDLPLARRSVFAQAMHRW